MSDWPVREITDPRMLRAMAHPLRIKLINALVLHGPATATELAQRVQDTAPNCSWHLRQLAKFGLIEEAEDLPRRGRNRPWRWVPVGNRWGNPQDSPDLVAAGVELTNALLGMELAERNAWEATRAKEAPHWQEAAFTMQTIGWLTAEELNEIHKQVSKLLMRYTDRVSHPTKRPPDSRPIRFIAWGNPAD